MSSEKHSIVHLSLSIIFAVFIVTTLSIILIQIGLNPSQIAMAQQAATTTSCQPNIYRSKTVA